MSQLEARMEAKDVTQHPTVNRATPPLYHKKNYSHKMNTAEILKPCPVPPRSPLGRHKRFWEYFSYSGKHDPYNPSINPYILKRLPRIVFSSVAETLKGRSNKASKIFCSSSSFTLTSTWIPGRTRRSAATLTDTRAHVDLPIIVSPFNSAQDCTQVLLLYHPFIPSISELQGFIKTHVLGMTRRAEVLEFLSWAVLSQW